MNGYFFVFRVILFDQIFSSISKIIETIWFVQQAASVVPFFSIFTASANICHSINTIICINKVEPNRNKTSLVSSQHCDHHTHKEKLALDLYLTISFAPKTLEFSYHRDWDKILVPPGNSFHQSLADSDSPYGIR